MKTTVTFNDFVDAFEVRGRGHQFSYMGKKMLFDYLEDYEDSTGEEIELDVIALCCDFSEEHYKDIADNYSIDLSDAEGDEKQEIYLVIEHLQYNTTFVGELNGMIVYQAF